MQDMPEDVCAIVSKEARFCSPGTPVQRQASANLLFQYFHYCNIYQQFSFLLEELLGTNLTSTRSVRLIVESSLKVMSRDCT